MKRNIILMGGKTYIISLPAPWIRSYGIKKGDEVDVLEEGSRVVVESGKNVRGQRVIIDITDSVSAYIWWAINAAYIKGVDEIEVVYSKKEEKVVNEITKTLIGFAVTVKKNNSIILKDISGTATEFDSIFRRIFFMLECFGKEGLSSAKSFDWAELKESKTKDYEINYSVNFCLRYLNKMGYSNYNETSFIYATLLGLESFGDEYADLFELISNSRVKLSSDYIRLIERVNNLFVLYSQIFFKYDKPLVLELINERYQLSQKISQLLTKSNKNETLVLSSLKTMVGILFNLAESKHVTI